MIVFGPQTDSFVVIVIRRFDSVSSRTKRTVGTEPNATIIEDDQFDLVTVLRLESE